METATAPMAASEEGKAAEGGLMAEAGRAAGVDWQQVAANSCTAHMGCKLQPADGLSGPSAEPQQSGCDTEMEQEHQHQAHEHQQKQGNQVQEHQAHVEQTVQQEQVDGYDEEQQVQRTPSSGLQGLQLVAQHAAPPLFGAYCLNLDNADRRQLSSALIGDTVSAMAGLQEDNGVQPVLPSQISNVVGPVLEIEKVDSHSVNVKISHSFRASFPEPVADLRDRKLAARLHSSMAATATAALSGRAAMPAAHANVQQPRAHVQRPSVRRGNAHGHVHDAGRHERGNGHLKRGGTSMCTVCEESGSEGEQAVSPHARANGMCQARAGTAASPFAAMACRADSDDVPLVRKHSAVKAIPIVEEQDDDSSRDLGSSELTDDAESLLHPSAGVCTATGPQQRRQEQRQQQHRKQRVSLRTHSDNRQPSAPAAAEAVPPVGFGALGHGVEAAVAAHGSPQEAYGRGPGYMTLSPPQATWQCMLPRCEWELDPRKVLVGRRLAVGGFAEVFIGKYEGTAVAVKRLLAADAATGQKFVSEIKILARLRHPNLILFIGFCAAPEMCIISEYMARGSLYSIMRAQDGRPLEPKLQRTVAISVARGMAYLHSRTPPILHLDLKSPNILVDDRWRVKITDFGLSRSRARTVVSTSAQGGTPEWMAPEVLRCEPITEAADVYSYGVVLWELLTGQSPWHEFNSMQVVGIVGYSKGTLPCPTQGDPFLVNLCMRCMQQDPTARPTFSQIVAELDRQYGPPSWQHTATPLLPPTQLALPPTAAQPRALPAPEAGNTSSAEAAKGRALARAVVGDKSPFAAAVQQSELAAGWNGPGGTRHAWAEQASNGAGSSSGGSSSRSSSGGVIVQLPEDTSTSSMDGPSSSTFRQQRQKYHHQQQQQQQHAAIPANSPFANGAFANGSVANSPFAQVAVANGTITSTPAGNSPFAQASFASNSPHGSPPRGSSFGSPFGSPVVEPDTSSSSSSYRAAAGRQANDTATVAEQHHGDVFAPSQQWQVELAPSATSGSLSDISSGPGSLGFRSKGSQHPSVAPSSRHARTGSEPRSALQQLLIGAPGAEEGISASSALLQLQQQQQQEHGEREQQQQQQQELLHAGLHSAQEEWGSGVHAFLERLPPDAQAPSSTATAAAPLQLPVSPESNRLASSGSEESVSPFAAIAWAPFSTPTRRIDSVRSHPLELEAESEAATPEHQQRQGQQEGPGQQQDHISPPEQRPAQQHQHTQQQGQEPRALSAFYSLPAFTGAQPLASPSPFTIPVLHSPFAAHGTQGMGTQTSHAQPAASGAFTWPSGVNTSAEGSLGVLFPSFSDRSSVHPPAAVSLPLLGAAGLVHRQQQRTQGAGWNVPAPVEALANGLSVVPEAAEPQHVPLQSGPEQQQLGQTIEAPLTQTQPWQMHAADPRLDHPPTQPCPLVAAQPYHGSQEPATGPASAACAYTAFGQPSADGPSGPNSSGGCVLASLPLSSCIGAAAASDAQTAVATGGAWSPPHSSTEGLQLQSSYKKGRFQVTSFSGQKTQEQQQQHLQLQEAQQQQQQHQQQSSSAARLHSWALPDDALSACASGSQAASLDHHQLQQRLEHIATDSSASGQAPCQAQSAAAQAATSVAQSAIGESVLDCHGQPLSPGSDGWPSMRSVVSDAGSTSASLQASTSMPALATSGVCFKKGRFSVTVGSASDVGAAARKPPAAPGHLPSSRSGSSSSRTAPPLQPAQQQQQQQQQHPSVRGEISSDGSELLLSGPTSQGHSAYTSPAGSRRVSEDASMWSLDSSLALSSRGPSFDEARQAMYHHHQHQQQQQQQAELQQLLPPPLWQQQATHAQSLAGVASASARPEHVGDGPAELRRSLEHPPGRLARVSQYSDDLESGDQLLHSYQHAHAVQPGQQQQAGTGMEQQPTTTTATAAAGAATAVKGSVRQGPAPPAFAPSGQLAAPQHRLLQQLEATQTSPSAKAAAAAAAATPALLLATQSTPMSFTTQPSPAALQPCPLPRPHSATARLPPSFSSMPLPARPASAGAAVTGSSADDSSAAALLRTAPAHASTGVAIVAPDGAVSSDVPRSVSGGRDYTKGRFTVHEALAPMPVVQRPPQSAPAAVLVAASQAAAAAAAQAGVRRAPSADVVALPACSQAPAATAPALVAVLLANGAAAVVDGGTSHAQTVGSSAGASMRATRSTSASGRSTPTAMSAAAPASIAKAAAAAAAAIAAGASTKKGRFTVYNDVGPGAHSAVVGGSSSSSLAGSPRVAPSHKEDADRRRTAAQAVQAMAGPSAMALTSATAVAPAAAASAPPKPAIPAAAAAAAQPTAAAPMTAPAAKPPASRSTQQLVHHVGRFVVTDTVPDDGTGAAAAVAQQLVQSPQQRRPPDQQKPVAAAASAAASAVAVGPACAPCGQALSLPLPATQLQQAPPTATAGAAPTSASDAVHIHSHTATEQPSPVGSSKPVIAGASMTQQRVHNQQQQQQQPVQPLPLLGLPVNNSMAAAASPQALVLNQQEAPGDLHPGSRPHSCSLALQAAEEAPRSHPLQLPLHPL